MFSICHLFFSTCPQSNVINIIGHGGFLLDSNMIKILLERQDDSMTLVYIYTKSPGFETRHGTSDSAQGVTPDCAFRDHSVSAQWKFGD